MKTKRLALALAVAGVLGASSVAQAALLFYSSEAAFDAAASGLTTQDFSAANLGGGNFATMANPLDSSTNNGIFATGDIAAGLSISATGSNPDDLAILSPAVTNTGTTAVFANNFVETLNLSFAPGAGAVGLGLLSLFDVSDFTLSFFDASNGLLGSTSVPNVSDGVTNTDAATFFGVVATGLERIARINLSSDSGQSEGIDRVKFGAAPQAVPEPGTLALVGLALAVIGFGRRYRRR